MVNRRRRLMRLEARQRERDLANLPTEELERAIELTNRAGRHGIDALSEAERAQLEKVVALMEDEAWM